MHVLVNNAGGALGLEPVAQADVELWQQMYATNVLGTLRVTKALLPALVAADGEGVVVNVGSIAGFLAYEGGGGYTVAKHGVHVMTETLRLELVDQPVRITLVAPGMVRTEEFSLTRFGGDQERADAVYAGVPNPLVAEDVADAIVWMATRPAHVNIDLLVVKPRVQAAPHKVHREPTTPTATPTRPDRSRGWDAAGQGWRRLTSHEAASPRSPSPTRVNTSRSCSRLRRPAQNSTSSGTIRKPPQKSGTGTSSSPPRSGKAAARAAYCASSSAREPIGSDCRDAHAEIRDAHGRESKYSSTSSRDTSTAVPRNRIARYIAGQVRDAADRRGPGQLAPLGRRQRRDEPRAALVEEAHQHGAHVRAARRHPRSPPRSPAARRRRGLTSRPGHGVVDPGPRLRVGGARGARPR